MQGKQEYVERLNTPDKLMVDMLEQNIKAVDIMAANMFNPDDYAKFDKLMKKLVKMYR